MSEPHRAPGAASPRAVRVAVLTSVALHGLLLAFTLGGRGERPTARPIDSRVVAGGAYLLSLDDAPPRRKGPAGSTERSEPFIPVRMAPPQPGAAFNPGPAPTVDLGAMPGAAPGRGGAGDAATFFGVPITGPVVVFVIDRSLSMGPSRALAAARAELLSALRALPPGAKFQVIFYNRTGEPLTVDGASGLLPADPTTLGHVAGLVAAVRPEGGTDHAKALRRGLAFRPDVLFLVTDADDLTAEQVRAITRFNGGGAVVHAVDVGPRRAAAMLEELARANRGRYFWRGR